MEKRRIVVSIKFSEQELDLIDGYAYDTNRKRSAYIREVVLGKVPRQKPPDEFYEILKQLRYISNSLNQIAVRAHKLNRIDELKYQKEVDTLNEFILEVKKKFLT